jgi:chloride channel 3/4/5
LFQIPWLLLGVIGVFRPLAAVVPEPYLDLQGVLGSILIKLNVAVATYRHTSSLKEWPLLEVLGVSAITAAMSYLVRAPSTNEPVVLTCVIVGGIFEVNEYELEPTMIVYAGDGRVQTSELVANLFQECDPNKGDYHGLCKYAPFLRRQCSS